MSATVEHLPAHVTPAELTPADDQELDRRLRQAVAAFLVRYRPSTRETYRIGIRQWIDWCTVVGIDPLAPDRPHVELYARHLEEAGRARSTVTHKINILSSWYKILHADGIIDRNPFPAVRRPRVDRVSTTNGMTQLQLARALEAADAEGLQSRCISHLLAFAALRNSTLCSLAVENLATVAGTMVLTVETKGDTLLTIGIPPATTWHLQHLIEQRGTGPLFLNEWGLQLTPANLRAMVRRWARAAGIRQRITPHSFRHTFITLARQAGMRPEEIAAVSGHADERMLAYYDRTPAVMRSSIATARIATQILAA